MDSQTNEIDNPDCPKLWFQVCSCEEDKMLCGFDNDKTNICHICYENDADVNNPRDLPCPLVDITRIGFDLVLIPSGGHFLNGFKGHSNLHIGLVQHNILYEFDHDGLNITDIGKEETNRWQHCLPLDIMSKLKQMISSADHIDILSEVDCVIDKLLNDDRYGNWKSVRYDEHTKNCFDFAIKFLTSLLDSLIDHKTILADRVKEFSKLICDKTSFCQHLIVPKTTNLSRYLAMRKMILDDKMTK